MPPEKRTQGLHMSAEIFEFRPRTATAKQNEPETTAPHNSSLPYSFDIYQSHANGMVAIDACVPAHVAAAMLEMLRTSN
jgi:hypothetical protein